MIRTQGPMLDITGLVKRFGALTAVDNVSFSVGAGEVLGFLGPNGAGKSTTMKMVAGFLEPDAGRVRVVGLDVARQPVEVKASVGYLPEGAPLYGDMTARRFLGFIAEVRGYRGAARRRKVDEVVQRLHLGPILDKTIDTLSKGFKRRVGLAQAIIHDPPVLILDEPTDGLDPNQKHEVRELIGEISPSKAIVLSTHILEEVEAVCSRAIIISEGRILFDGTPDALLARSRRHRAVRLSVGSADPRQTSEALAQLPGVESVEHLGEAAGWVDLRIFPVDGAALAGPVGELARSRGWPVRELHVEEGRLDEVFRQVTTGADPAARSA